MQKKRVMRKRAQLLCLGPYLEFANGPQITKSAPDITVIVFINNHCYIDDNFVLCSYECFGIT